MQTKFLLPLILWILCATALLAQAPQQFSYQAVARASNGDVLATKQVALRLSLLNGAPNGPMIYQETHSTTTNNLGLFTLQIGNGNVQSGSFGSISWGGGAKYLRVELDPNGGSNYVNMGVTPLLSVPYALYAEEGGTPYTQGNGIQINGQVISNTGDLNGNDDVLMTTNFGGDVTGTYDNIQLKPNTVGGTEITDQSVLGSDLHPMGANTGEVLKWNGSVWAPATDISGSGGSYNAGTGININGSTISALNDNVLWNALKLYGRDISSAVPNAGQVLKWNGNLWAPADDEQGSGGGNYQAGSGISINGTTISALSNDAIWNANRLQGNFVSTSAPANGQALVWNNANARWEPQTLTGNGLGGNGTGNYIAKFTGTNTLGNSVMYESGSGVGIGTTNVQGKFQIKGTADQSQLIIEAYTVQSNNQPIIQTLDGGGAELFRIHTDDNRNLFFGLRAGSSNQVVPTMQGEFNTFLGSQSGEFNTSGSYNTGTGYETLKLNTGGTNNSALGAFALGENISGSFNTGLGTFALRDNATGQSNTSIGASAMSSNTTGSTNTAIGASALNGNGSGSGNTAAGQRSMFNNFSGTRNVAIGQDAMYQSSIGNYNVAVGTHALYRNATRSNLVAVGDSALFNNGMNALDITQAIGNTALGSKALYSNTTGSENTGVGYQALFGSTVGSKNTGVGYQALHSNTLGEENTAVGYQAMMSNFTGLYNTATGFKALQNNAEGSRNTATGYFALQTNHSGVDNTANGYQALQSTIDGESNVAVGAKALSANTIGSYNTSVGAFALEFPTNALGNTALGYDAGGDYVNGNYNTFIGYNTKTNLSGYTNSTALGANAQITASNQVRLGNDAVTSIGGIVGWTNYSDARIKKDIQENVGGLAFIQRLRPVTYHLNLEEVSRITGSPSAASAGSEQASIRYTGFIAQEVAQAARESGYSFSGVDQPKSETDLYGLRYAEFVAPLVKAVQEQQVLIQAQGDMIRQLQEELKAIKEKMD
jgi:hypothetical protein